MPVPRPYLVFLVVASVLLATAPPAAAAPARPTVEIVHETVSWIISAGQCPSLPAGVSVTADRSGRRHSVTVTIPRADGGTTIINHDVVTGTAEGSNHRTYHFAYENHVTQTVPPSGGPIAVDMTDAFVLHGPPGGGSVNAGFHWRWTYNPPLQVPTPWPPVDNLQQLSTRGYPQDAAAPFAPRCDPI